MNSYLASLLEMLEALGVSEATREAIRTGGQFDNLGPDSNLPALANLILAGEAPRGTVTIIRDDTEYKQ